MTPSDIVSPPVDVTRMILASKAIGQKIFDVDGHHVGHVDDIAVEKATGKIGYVIAAFGDFLGLGGKLVPIPWSELDYDKHKEGYAVRLNQEQLRKAPAYDKDQLADLGDHMVWVFI